MIDFHEEIWDTIIVGAGPAGIAAAVSAVESGLKKVLVLERNERPGGILLQCIHTGFGLTEFKEELTGPEYSYRWIDKANKAGVAIRCDTIVLGISECDDQFGRANGAGAKFKSVKISSKETGIKSIITKSVILAMGCRERTRSSVWIPGSRPAGVITAGCAQNLVNLRGLLPGKRVVILGSGDIGLIMARRMTLEGAKIVCVCEKMPYPGGLERNVWQCLRDFDIPLYLSCSVIQIHGKRRVEGVTLADFDEEGNIVAGSERYVECDTVMLSVGLIPENELTVAAGIEINEVTNGPVLKENLSTSVDGIFACGNVLKVYDLVDNVSADSVITGRAVAAYVHGEKHDEKLCDLKEKTFCEEIPDSNSTERFVVCTVCPTGCRIKASLTDEGEWQYEGYVCKRGHKFAMTELTDPERVLTTTVFCRTGKDDDDYLSAVPVAVKSSKPVRAADFEMVMRRIKSVVFDYVPEYGKIVIENVDGAGANIIITGDRR